MCTVSCTKKKQNKLPRFAASELWWWVSVCFSVFDFYWKKNKWNKICARSIFFAPNACAAERPAAADGAVSWFLSLPLLVSVADKRPFTSARREAKNQKISKGQVILCVGTVWWGSTSVWGGRGTPLGWEEPMSGPAGVPFGGGRGSHTKPLLRSLKRHILQTLGLWQMGVLFLQSGLSMSVFVCPQRPHPSQGTPY